MILALIIFLPLTGYLLLSLFSKMFRERSVGILASMLIGMDFLLSLFLFLSGFRNGQPFQMELYTWISASEFQASFGLQADALTLVMMLVVTGVSAIIHVYSIGYMKSDPNFGRFFAYLNLFVFFMLLLVMSDNYLLLFAGWEGVGLCSYLLIGFWFRNPEYASAANKAFIMNRVGDLGFLLGIAIMFMTFGSLSFASIETQLQQGIGIQSATIIALLLFAGAIGKSAQIPLFTWLPDAMAGPTPVSALIHAATMVTAGIYLVIRSSALFVLSPLSMYLVACTGIVTALFAGTIALKQNDIKKILAYSTVSQLGLMFFALGLGAFDAAFFHLITHAFFKALLFLCAGSIIHALHGQQDIMQMGGLRKGIRITFITMVIGAFAISGIPPLSGFFSKEGILTAAWNANPVLWLLAFTASVLTAFYMFRLIYLVFYGNYRGSPSGALHESPPVMTIPLVILALLSIAGGFINVPALFGGSERLSGYLGFVGTGSGHQVMAGWLTGIFTVLCVIVIIIYNYFHFYVRLNLPVSQASSKGISRLLAGKYYVDEFYAAVIIKPFMWVSARFFDFIETWVVDGIVEGIGRTVIGLSRTIRYVQSGSISFYLLFMVLGIIFVLVFNLFL